MLREMNCWRGRRSYILKFKSDGTFLLQKTMLMHSMAQHQLNRSPATTKALNFFKVLIANRPNYYLLKQWVLEETFWIIVKIKSHWMLQAKKLSHTWPKDDSYMIHFYINSFSEASFGSPFCWKFVNQLWIFG